MHKDKNHTKKLHKHHVKTDKKYKTTKALRKKKHKNHKITKASRKKKQTITQNYKSIDKKNYTKNAKLHKVSCEKQIKKHIQNTQKTHPKHPPSPVVVLVRHPRCDTRSSIDTTPTPRVQLRHLGGSYATCGRSYR